MAPLDPAILSALGEESHSNVSVCSGASGFSETCTLQLPNRHRYFLKQSASRVMIEGEAESYRHLADAVPGFCPTVYARGACRSSQSWFLITSVLDFSRPNETSLAHNLSRLHASTTTRGYGFPVSTCCADTVQCNDWHASWTHFFTERRLRPIALLGSNAQDAQLAHQIDTTCARVVPRLLDALVIQPALIHGDLWSGNHRAGYVFDSCAMYAHSEYEIGIMSMFGGLSQTLQAYHRLKPKDEPVAEYDDRIALYMVYHQLNHSGTGQGSGYKSSAKATLTRLIEKYG